EIRAFHRATSNHRSELTLCRSDEAWGCKFPFVMTCWVLSKRVFGIGRFSASRVGQAETQHQKYENAHLVKLYANYRRGRIPAPVPTAKLSTRAGNTCWYTDDENRRAYSSSLGLLTLVKSSSSRAG